MFPALLPSRLKALEATGCDLAIIDTPAVSKDTASAAMRHADLVLIPTKPAAFDLRSMLETIEQAQALGRPYAIVLTLCPPLHGPELHATLARIAELHHEMCPVLIHQYIAYPRAQKHGLSVQELEPAGKAAAEIKQLYAYTCRRLGLRRHRLRTKPQHEEAEHVTPRQTGRHHTTRSPQTGDVDERDPIDTNGRAVRSQDRKPKPGARAGTRLIAGHFPDSTLKALKHLMAEEDATLQALLEEAIDDLLVKKGRAKLANA